MRLGATVSFETRQGAQFVETWVDGFAFRELTQQQEAIIQQKEELEKQRKLLTKRRGTSSSGSSGGIALSYCVTAIFFSLQLNLVVVNYLPQLVKMETILRNHNCQRKLSHTHSLTLYFSPSLPPAEYHERDDMLKLRAAALKKVH